MSMLSIEPGQDRDQEHPRPDKHRTGATNPNNLEAATDPTTHGAHTSKGTAAAKYRAIGPSRTWQAQRTHTTNPNDSISAAPSATAEGPSFIGSAWNLACSGPFHHRMQADSGLRSRPQMLTRDQSRPDRGYSGSHNHKKPQAVFRV